jgi:hypothetical protein
VSALPTTLPSQLKKETERSGDLAPLISMTTTPAVRRFLIIFSIVEAAMIAWAFVAPHVR